MRAGGFAALFVLVWSSGYVAGSIGTAVAHPGALGFWRFLIATAVLGLAVAVRGARWPADRTQWTHQLVIGVLLQNVQFTGAFLAIEHGLSAGLAALIADASPLPVAVGSAWWFGERLRRTQLIGLIVGLAGVGLVVIAGSATRLSGVGLLAAGVGLAGSASGTLWQKAARPTGDLLTTTFVQLIGATVSMLPVALLSGGLSLPLTGPAVGSVLWLAGVGSILAFVLLFRLLRARPGASATSLLFLVPPVTAVAGAVVLHQPLTIPALIGLAVAAAGVALVAKPVG